MAGIKKPAKPGFEPMTKTELRKYYLEQMERAKKSLEEKTRRGNERGIKRAAEIIQDLERRLGRM